MFNSLRQGSRVVNTLILSSLTIPVVALGAGSALADKADFRVYNDSSMVLTELYVSSSSQNTWDNDILGRDVLYQGGEVQVLFNDSSPNHCLYDIRAVFEDGQVVEDYRIDVCAGSEYTFFDN
jgi:hypothetical protein